MTLQRKLHFSPRTRRVTAGVAAIALLALLAPLTAGDLGGTSNVNDLVQLSTPVSSVGTISVSPLGATDSAPPAIYGSAFTVNNEGSNVDTFIRYAWASTPTFGTGASVITLRGSTHYVANLLWFKQETLTGASVATASQYFSPLLLKNDATASRATFTSDGDACTAWSGTAGANPWTPTVSGTLAFPYHAAASQTDDTPTSSDTFYWCLDTTNSQVYIGKSQSFTAATLVVASTTGSSNAVLKSYQYEFLSGSQTEGNAYCLTGVTGTGTSATPDLAQCEMLPYDTAGSTTGKVHVLLDLPPYFPSNNEVGGPVSFTLTGTQWNPYSPTSTNSAG